MTNTSPLFSRQLVPLALAALGSLLLASSACSAPVEPTSTGRTSSGGSAGGAAGQAGAAQGGAGNGPSAGAGQGGQGGAGASGASGKGGAAGKGGEAGSAGISGSSGQAGEAGASGASGAGATSGGAGSGGSASAGGEAGEAGAGGSAGTAGAAGSVGEGGSAGQAGTAGTGGTAGSGGAAWCGDGKKSGTEPCEGIDLGGADCAAAVGPGSTGTLGCKADCTFDTSGCSGRSCKNVDPTCGPPDKPTSCCASDPVPAGSFMLGRGATGPDACTNGLACQGNETEVKATLSAFRLDRYEVTIGRFRAFREALVAGWKPAPGAGKHAHLAAGALDGEIGWDPAWPLPADLGWASEASCSPGSLWTSEPGAHEDRPVACVTWYEAQAFCIWDGGYLPTEAEWEHAASGGQERLFPWSDPPSDPTIDHDHASYGNGFGECYGDGEPGCTEDDIHVPGRKPKGDARWGHADMGGNMWEWTQDLYAGSYLKNPCNDCVNLPKGDDTSSRTMRGGGYYNGTVGVLATWRAKFELMERNSSVGIRCARVP